MTFRSNLPLHGKTVVLTRSQDQQSQARVLFEKFGARVLDLPALVIGPPSEWTSLDNALLDLKNFNWIIFSSANGVKAVEKRLQIIGSSIATKPKTLKIAAVGKKTAQSLKLFGVVPDFVPPQFVADSLIQHFPESANGLRILIPRVQTGGRDILAKEFDNGGACVVEVPAYESQCPKDFPSETARALQNYEVDAILFTSAKTAAHTAQLISTFFGAKWKNILLKVKLISIGPQTSNGCKKYFHRVDQEAIQHDLDGLVLACIKLLSDQP